MDENSNIQTLSNDLVMRLLNTSEALGVEARIGVVDNCTQKLVNSGFQLDQTRKIITNGIKGYEKRLRESYEVGGRRLHRTGGESSTKRSRKKLLDRTEWFKKKKVVDCEEQAPPMTQEYGGKHKKKQQSRICGPQTQTQDIKTRTIIFVEQTRDSKLAKELREVLKRLEGILGFRVKVCERTGSKMKDLFSNTNPWSGSHCGRVECVTCNQDTEDKPPCTKRSLVYEHICVKCNPDARKKGPLVEMNMNIPSIYVGETARSIQERVLEHWSSYRAGNADSHILKHMELHHTPTDAPEFIMKVVGFHRTALSRQCGEAVRILRRGLGLNSKSEFSRCHIQRLSLVQPDKETLPARESEMSENKDWTEGMWARRINLDRGDRICLGKVKHKVGGKRVERGKESNVQGGERKNKRLKYDVASEDWGLVGMDRVENNNFLFSGLEGVRRQNNHVSANARHSDKPGKIDQNRKITDWVKKASGGTKEDVTECAMTKVVPNVRKCETLALEWDGYRILPIKWIPQKGEGGQLNPPDPLEPKDDPI